MRLTPRTWPAALAFQPLTGLLVLANVAAYVVAGSATDPTFRALALVPADLLLRPWAVVTHAFLHADLWQLGLELAALLLIAPRLEQRAGGRALIGWYVGGALAALPLAFFAPEAAFAGSAAAVLAVLIGFARRLPDEAVVSGLPGKGRWLVPLLVCVGLLPAVATGPSAPVAIAHIGAAVMVALFLVRPSKRAPVREIELPNSHYNAPGVTAEPAGTPWDTMDLDALHEVNREAVVGVLEKARSLGTSHLTSSEREFLDRMYAASQLNSVNRWLNNDGGRQPGAAA